MKQPKIHIVDKNGTDFGVKDVVTLSWNLDGVLSAIQVDFMGKHRDLMPMYIIDGNPVFINPYGNLMGRIIWD
jgi:hypothetical protein